MVLYRTFDCMILCGTKNCYFVASLEAPFEAPLFLRVYLIYAVWPLNFLSNCSHLMLSNYK